MMQAGQTTWLSVIIPAYNEAGRLGRSLLQVNDCSRRTGRPIEIIVVDDGSADGTGELAGKVARDNGFPVRVLTFPVNHGKGFAVRQGMLEARGELLLMADADMSTPIQEIDKLLPWLEQGFDVAIGSRAMPDSTLGMSRHWMRRIMERVFRAVRRQVMLPDIRDTQCGFKCFTRRAAVDVFRRLTTQGFAFDCEALGLARLLGYKVKEVGVVWCDDPDSRLKPLRDAVKMLLSLLRIRRRLRNFTAPS